MKNLVLCFLKFPQPGHVKTRLAHDLGDPGAAELYEALAERVITEVYPLEGGYDLRLCFDPAHPVSEFVAWLGESWRFQPQRGSDLGERMSHAVRDALADGYQKVVIIGTDCVGMDEPFLAGVLQSLDRDDVVLGPSTDGGYYLLAVKADHDWLFEDIPWSTEQVLATTVDRIEARELRHTRLEEKVDIDTIEDLIRFRKALPEEHFLCRKIDHIIIDRLSLPE